MDPRAERSLITMTLVAGSAWLGAGCAAEPQTAELRSIYGPWVWVGSQGGITGLSLTPESEGYAITYFFRRDGILDVWRGDTLQQRERFETRRQRRAGESRLQVQLVYDRPLTLFPFDPGIDRHDLREAGPDTLVLADPCCDRYEHTFVRAR